MITRLLDMVDPVASSLQTQAGRDTLQTDSSENRDKDIMAKKGTTASMPSSESSEMADNADNSGRGMEAAGMNLTAGEQHSETEAGMEKPAISDLQAAADEFNAAFNIALYELESSRKQSEERSVRINELNESIKTISSALTDEVSKGRIKEEEHTRETEQMNQRIHDIESEQDRLNQQVNEKESILNTRAEEINHLTSRIEELTNTLEQRIAEGKRAQEEFVCERDILTSKHNELQELCDKADSQLITQQKELEARDKVVADISSQVDSLTTELESQIAASERQEEAHNQETTRLGTNIKGLNENLQATEKLLEQRCNELESGGKEISWLKDHVNELKEEIDAQAESMRLQSESHAGAIEELNARIRSISGELESLHAVHKELGTHAENLEKLNHALHESSMSENAMHKKVLEEKTREVESLRTQLEAANELLKGQPENAAAAEKMQMAMNDLGSRLKEAEAQKQMLGERATVADELEAEVGQLRAALQEARDTGPQGAVDGKTLQGQVADLQSALESSRAEQEALAGKLRDHEALEQEVMNLRKGVQHANNKSLEQSDVSATYDALSDETEKLKSTLSITEEKYEQLQSALSGSSAPDGAGTGDTSPATQASPPVAEIIDRKRFMSHLSNLLAEQGGSGEKQTIMYILLDNLIQIRDEIGIMNSEHVINEISGIIVSQCDDDDIISRFGDCTFAILSSNESTDKAREKAETIRSTIEHHILESSGRSLTTTTSIGICSNRKNDTSSAEEVVSRADLACEAARSSGGNQVLVNSAIADEIIMLGSNENHKEMVSKTLSENRIKIYYQPISSLKDIQGSHYEVLIRIVDESGNIILPGEFFSMAVNSGQATDIDLYVIESIMKTMSEKPDQEMKLFIKLTGQSVADHELPVWIMGKIKEYRINPEQLVFEVAESILQSDLKNLSMLSKALNAIGCKIAIEHYQLSTKPQHLRNIHADYIKIDRGLVENISSKSESLSKVTAIIDIARKHKYITIAEGVESPACLAMLWELGVSFTQGYFIQEPAGNRVYDFHGADSESEEAEDGKATYTLG